MSSCLSSARVSRRGPSPDGSCARAASSAAITRDDVVRSISQPPSPEPSSSTPEAKAPPSAPAAPSTPAPSGAAAELSQLIQAGGGFVPPIPGVGFGAYKVPPYVQKPGDEV